MENEVFNGRYRLGQKIGAGSFGEIYMGVFVCLIELKERFVDFGW